MTPPPLRHHPRCFVLTQNFWGINQVFLWFPGSIIVRVSLPLNKVLETVVTGAVIQDLLNNILGCIIDCDWRRWQLRESLVWERGWVMVRMEEGHMEDQVDVQGVWKFQFVCHSRDLLNDPVRADELVLQFLGGA